MSIWSKYQSDTVMGFFVTVRLRLSQVLYPERVLDF